MSKRNNMGMIRKSVMNAKHEGKLVKIRVLTEGYEVNGEFIEQNKWLHNDDLNNIGVIEEEKNEDKPIN